MSTYDERNTGLEGLGVLVIENAPSSRKRMVSSLEACGARVYSAWNSKKTASILRREDLHVLIASIPLINEELIEAVKTYKHRRPETLFYVLTDREYSSVEASSEAIRIIVNDYLSKPLDVERLGRLVETELGGASTSDSISIATIDPLVEKVKPYFIFRSPVTRGVVSQIPRIAASDETVLITGETGTGKEIVARAIHMLSRNASGPFVPVNCGAIPESLIEDELFGHEKGAFTGAVRARKGKLESAENGTLFLDEIGDMKLNLQVRLLRILEDKELYRIGGETSVPVNIRVIAASNVDLFKAVKDGLFREDLYYRLNILRLHLPPLRERVEDISLLAVHFLNRAFLEMKRERPYPYFSPETIRLLESFPWRGNVRELRNFTTRVATLLPQDIRQIFPFHILPHLHEQDPTYLSPSRDTSPEASPAIRPGMKLKEMEEILIQETLKKTNGNRTRAADLLGLDPRTLRRKLNQPKSD